MPTIKTLNADGVDVDYSTFATWEDFADGEATADQWAECYGTGNLGQASLSGWASTATDSVYPKIYAAPGHEATNLTNGPLFSGTATISNSIAFVVWQGIRIFHTGTGATGRCIAIAVGNAILDGCVFMSGNATNAQNTILFASPSALYENTLKNCLIYNNGTVGVGIGLHLRCGADGQVNNLINNTFIVNSIAGNIALRVNENHAGSYTVNAKNNVFVGGDVAVDTTISIDGTLSFGDSGNNASTDGTAASVIGGSNNQSNIVVADEFTDSGSGDYTLKRTGVLYRGGVATANTTSLNGVTRHSPPDIGANETLSPGFLVIDPSTEQDFGSVVLGASEPQVSFDVTNTGEEDVPISLGTAAPAWCTIVQDLPGVIAAGATEEFIIEMQTDEVGEFSGNAVVAGDSNILIVPLVGEVVAPPLGPGVSFPLLGVG